MPSKGMAGRRADCRFAHLSRFEQKRRGRGPLGPSPQTATSSGRSESAGGGAPARQKGRRPAAAGVEAALR